MTDKCTTCGQTRQWHEENKPRHSFGVPGDGSAGKLNAKKEEPKRPPVVSGLGGDIALRLALVDAGVLEYSQIVLAEERIRAARDGGHAIIIRPTADPAGGPPVPGRSDGVPANPGPGDRSGA